MIRLLTLLLIALLHGALLQSAAAAQGKPADDLPKTPKAIVAEVKKRGKDAPKELFERLGERKDKAGLLALIRCFEHLEGQAPLSRATLACRHFAGLPRLEKRAIDALLEVALDRKAGRARAGVAGLASLGAAAHGALEEAIDEGKDRWAKAAALKPLVAAYTAEPNEDGLRRFLAWWYPGRTSTRASAIALLLAHDTPKQIAAMTEALEASDTPAPVRDVVLTAAGRAKTKGKAAKALDALVDFGLASEARDLRFRALEAVRGRGRVGDLELVKDLTEAEAPEVRREAYRALLALELVSGELDEERALEVAASEDRAARQAAALELARLASPATLDRLEDLLADDDKGVRSEAVRAFGARRRATSVPPLIERLDLESGKLRLEVHWVLRMLTGEDHGTRSPRWRAWWEAEGEGLTLPTLEEARAADEARGESAASQRSRTSFYGLAILSENLTFVIDTSGSMNAKTKSGATRLEEAREQLAQAVQRLAPTDRFNIVSFSARAHRWRDELTAASEEAVEDAVDFAGELSQGGATAIYNALEVAFRDESVDTIYLLSDGAPSGGTYDDVETILSTVERWNAVRRVTIHCIAVGQDHALLRALADDTGGRYKRVQ